MIRNSDALRFLRSIGKRHWLRLVETSSYQIPEQVLDLDRDLYVVLNTRTGKFEVHDAAVPIPAFTRILEADELDQRIIRRLHAARHANDPFAKAEEWAARERAAIARHYDDYVHGVAEVLADAAYHDLEGRRVFPK